MAIDNISLLNDNISVSILSFCNEVLEYDSPFWCTINHR